MTRLGSLDILGMIGRGHEYEELLAHALKMEVAADASVQVLDLEMLIDPNEGGKGG